MQVEKADPSSEHSSVASVPEKVKLATVSLVRFGGPLLIVGAGGAEESMCHSKLEAGPVVAADFTRTRNSWSPSASALYETGLEQAANGLPSSEHS